MIYIVEDDENIRELESFALSNSGYEVKAFADSTEFFAALDERVPELIILDIMLPGVSGLSILETVRSTESISNIPVILVTAKTTELERVKGLNMEVGS